MPVLTYERLVAGANPNLAIASRIRPEIVEAPWDWEIGKPVRKMPNGAALAGFARRSLHFRTVVVGGANDLDVALAPVVRMRTLVTAIGKREPIHDDHNEESRARVSDQDSYRSSMQYPMDNTADAIRTHDPYHAHPLGARARLACVSQFPA
jgi:hypothetical protein